MKSLIYILLSITLIACSVKKKSDNIESPPEDLKIVDSDGDKISDYDEIQLGLDRYVADIPSIDVKFLQDYNIKIKFQDENELEIDTKVERDNPNFKYRVGDLFLRKHSLNRAAEFGRFSGFSWGNIEQKDFSWVNYPDIDPEFYFYQKEKFNNLKNVDNKVSSIEITLSNVLKLNNSMLYDSIENLELNFYYYSYIKEKYVLLHSEIINRVFQSDEREDFDVVIPNVPVELIEETYFRKGEFIISEVKDFYIPQLKTKRSEILNSVKAKTIPVYVTTPLVNKLNYVSLENTSGRFTEILTRLYPNKFAINENSLKQVEQFSNSLPSFNYLHELDGLDKVGNWFVMTNRLKKHYLNHEFKNGEFITLSYITGDELSKQSKEIIHAETGATSSNKRVNIQALGNVDKNSEIEFTVFVHYKYGVRLNKKYESLTFAPPSCRNCSGNNWGVKASYSIVNFDIYKEDVHQDDLASIQSSMNILINNTELNLDELIKMNNLSIKIDARENGFYFHYKFKNIHEIDAFDVGSENALFIKLKPIFEEYHGQGLQLESIEGHNIDLNYHAGMICFREAQKRNLPLSVTSARFASWEKNVHWGERNPHNGYVPTRGEKRKYWDSAVVSIISRIKNNYN